MNISFSEINDLDESFDEVVQKAFDEYNQNPYFESNLLNTKNEIVQKNTDVSQQLKSIIKKPLQKTLQKPSQPNQPSQPMHRQHPEKRNKKKGISYDDILSSMNTVVIDGKLEFIRNDSGIRNPEIQDEPVKRVVKMNEPQQPTQIDPNVKNSYIFNKYFKDYKEHDNIETPQKPLTKEELMREIIINSVNKHNEQIRLSKIKSTKLLFNNNNKPSLRPRIIRRPTPPSNNPQTPAQHPRPSPRPTFNPNGSNHLFQLKK
jgi:hypothetical protein